MSEQTQRIIEKCEQYWNEHNINDAEIHVVLERIHKDAHLAADRIEELEAIVEKLPKTADGVPIVPGMAVYSADHRGYMIQYLFRMTTTHDDWSDTGEGHTLACYSTRAAAEAAKEGAGT